MSTAAASPGDGEFGNMAASNVQVAVRLRPPSYRDEGDVENVLRSQSTRASNSLLRQNLIGYLIVNLKLNLRGEKESKIHIPS